MGPQLETSTSNGNGYKNGSHPGGFKQQLNLQNLITIAVILASAFLTWQNTRDKIDFQAILLQNLTTRVGDHDIYIHNDREKLITLEGRMNAYDVGGCRPIITNRR